MCVLQPASPQTFGVVMISPWWLTLHPAVGLLLVPTSHRLHAQNLRSDVALNTTENVHRRGLVGTGWCWKLNRLFRLYPQCCTTCMYLRAHASLMTVWKSVEYQLPNESNLTLFKGLWQQKLSFGIRDQLRNEILNLPLTLNCCNFHIASHSVQCFWPCCALSKPHLVSRLYLIWKCLSQPLWGPL